MRSRACCNLIVARAAKPAALSFVQFLERALGEAAEFSVDLLSVDVVVVASAVSALPFGDSLDGESGAVADDPLGVTAALLKFVVGFASFLVAILKGGVEVLLKMSILFASRPGFVRLLLSAVPSKALLCFDS